MPWMIAQRMDLLALHEMVIASAVPNPIPTFAASFDRDVVSVIVPVRLTNRASAAGASTAGASAPARPTPVGRRTNELYLTWPRPPAARACWAAASHDPAPPDHAPWR